MNGAASFAQEDNLPVSYAPFCNSNELPHPDLWDIDLKISVFEKRVKGWTLDIAKRLVETDICAGYASLSIVLSYFEMISLYEDGIVEDIEKFIKGKGPATPSKKHFFAGVDSVARLANWRTDLSDYEKFKGHLYAALRCGLYHCGMARHGIWVVHRDAQPVYTVLREEVVINPQKLIAAIYRHFDRYVETLRHKTKEIGTGSKKSANILRNFEKRFQLEVLDKAKEKLREE